MTLDDYLAAHTGDLEILIHAWLAEIAAAVQVRVTDAEIEQAFAGSATDGVPNGPAVLSTPRTTTPRRRS